MSKKYLIILFCLSILALVCACSKNQNTNQDHYASNQSQNISNPDNQAPRWDENFENIDSSGLEIGAQIMAMGTQNSDGSITANQIIIVDSEFNFEDVAGGSMGGPPSGNTQQENRQNNQPQNMSSSDSSRQRPDFAQMQNMTDEERQAFREQMMAERGNMPADGGFGQTRNTSQTRSSGEVISFDESIITLKIADAGSRLIFYSPSTIFLKSKDQ